MLLLMPFDTLIPLMDKFMKFIFSTLYIHTNYMEKINYVVIENDIMLFRAGDCRIKEKNQHKMCD